MFLLSSVYKFLHYACCYKGKINRRNEEVTCLGNPCAKGTSWMGKACWWVRCPAVDHWSAGLQRLFFQAVHGFLYFFETWLKLPLLLKRFEDLHGNVISELDIDLHLLRANESNRMGVTGEINHFSPNVNFCSCVVWEKYHLMPKRSFKIHR